MSSSVSDLKPVYLIFGSEQLKLDQALARLKDRAAEGADLDFNYSQFDGESADIDEVVAACNTLPFASERRLVVLRNVDKVAKTGLDALTAYAENPSETTVLVMVAVKFAKNLKLYKAVQSLGGVAEYAAPRKTEYPAEVARLVSERGKEISRDAAELLVTVVGYDLRRLSVEVDKAVAFVGERSEIGRSDIEQVAATTAPTSVFEFLEALGDRDCRRSLRLLADLIGDGESVYGLHAMAVRQVRDLIAARSLLDRGRGGVAELARELGRPDWQVKRLARQASRFRQEELAALLRGAAASEADMKTSRDSRLAFERWIVSACS